MKMGIWTRALNRQSATSHFITYPGESACKEGGLFLLTVLHGQLAEDVTVEDSCSSNSWKVEEGEGGIDQGLRSSFESVHPFKDLEFPKAPPLRVSTVFYC